MNGERPGFNAKIFVLILIAAAGISAAVMLWLQGDAGTAAAPAAGPSPSPSAGAALAPAAPEEPAPEPATALPSPRSSIPANAGNNGQAVYAAMLSQLATECRRLDSAYEHWLASGFTGQVEGSFERPFFALFAPDAAFRGTFAPNAEAQRAELRSRAREVRDALREADQAAERANVPAADRHAVRERYGFTHAFWDQ